MERRKFKDYTHIQLRANKIFRSEKLAHYLRCIKELTKIYCYTNLFPLKKEKAP